MPDADRALTAEGREKLRRVLKRARRRGVAPALILSSPYRRAWRRRRWRPRCWDTAARWCTREALVPEASPYDVWEEIRARQRTSPPSCWPSHEPLMSATVAFLLGSPAHAGGHEESGAGARGLRPLRRRSRTAILKWMLTPGHGRRVRPMALSMKIAKATAKYEAWLGTPPDASLEADLNFKHEQMRSGRVSLSARHLLSLGADLGGGLRRGRARAQGAGGGRSARGELRNLARHRRPPDLGHQRFRRSLAPAVHQRPDPPGRPARCWREIGCDPKAGIAAILKGYVDALEAGGRPFVLAEHHPALRAHGHRAGCKIRKPYLGEAARPARMPRRTLPAGAPQGHRHA